MLLLVSIFTLRAALACARNPSQTRDGPIDAVLHDYTDLQLSATPNYIRPCYFTNWAQYRNGRAKYVPEDYVPGLCTHILYAFGWMNDDFTVRAFDPADLPNDWAGEGMFRRVNALKKRDPGLKTLLSIGGWSFGTALFKAMSATETNRKKFINSAIAFVRQWGFDGVDIDWEYPAGDDDKKNFVLLVTELKDAAIEEHTRSGKERLLVTAAVSGGEATIKQAYDIPAIADKLDFVLLMNYDFHGAWSNEIGFNSPLYPRENMVQWQKVWNIDWAANHWAEGGMPKEKIVIGIATYGRGWTLKDPNNATVGAHGTPAKTTKYVGEAGVAAYYEFCEMLSNGAKRFWDSEQQVPYLVHGDQWFGYDDEESIANKMAWLKRHKFGGAFVWTLDFDDFNAKCPNSNGKPYPLISIIARELGGVVIKSIEPPTKPPVTTTTAPYTTTRITFTTTPSAELRKKCDGRSDGFYRLSDSCDKFLLCVKQLGYTMSCPAGLHFNEAKGHCVPAVESDCVPPTVPPPPAPAPAPSPVTGESTGGSGGSFECPVDGFYPDKSDCKKFYRCVGGTAHSFDCPPSLAFNKNTLQCDHPNDANCA